MLVSASRSLLLVPASKCIGNPGSLCVTFDITWANIENI